MKVKKKMKKKLKKKITHKRTYNKQKWPMNKSKHGKNNQHNQRK